MLLLEMTLGQYSALAPSKLFRHLCPVRNSNKIHLAGSASQAQLLFDPLGRSTVIAENNHYFHVCRLFVHLTSLLKVKQRMNKRSFSLLVGLWSGRMDHRRLLSYYCGYYCENL